MRAVQFDAFGGPLVVREVDEPSAPPLGAVIRVETTGLCRSDIHGWQGHDSGIALPHVPGHEFVGWIDSVGEGVGGFAVGDRVTVPFVCACGSCRECRRGNGQVCHQQTQPGFTHWGSFAEKVAIHQADLNLIPVEAQIEAGAAALLGCRFATSYRGLLHRAQLRAGEWLLVVGCGGVGSSAVMIGRAVGARVIALDIDPAALDRARSLGADHTIDAAGRAEHELVTAISDISEGGVDVAVEALGRADTIALSVRALATSGRQVQIGLVSAPPALPMAEVIARELTVYGSHGMARSDYAGLLAAVRDRTLRPERIIDRHIGLEEVPEAMAQMASLGDGPTREDIGAGVEGPGVTVIDVSPR